MIPRRWMTERNADHKIDRMKTMPILAAIAASLLLPLGAVAQKDADLSTSVLNFLVVKDENGKPVRNASVIMHPVNSRGRQEHGGLELKTDSEGKSSSEGIPYGKLRVQVLASGFQTYGEDFDIEQPTREITIRLKRPQSQYSIYEDNSKSPNAQPKQSSPQQSSPPDKQSQKPN